MTRIAARHAHVLVVEVPGHWKTRAAVERAVVERGWRLAESPADADVLAVCGPVGPTMADLLDVVWGQLPGPRARVEVGEQGAVTSALEQAHAVLLDTAHHVEDANSRPTLVPRPNDEPSGVDHGGVDHGGMEHGDMDHGEMEMAPDGIPLAEGGEDRDGLEMDALHVRLGPILPFWTGGLVLRCSLQGDVIVEADAHLVDAPPVPAPVDEATWAARRCDNASGLLALAGCVDAAVQTRAVRDAVLNGVDPGEAAARLGRLRRMVARSRMLRWSLRGVRPLTEADLEEHNLPAHLLGDTHDRLLSMLERARRALAEPSVPVVHADTTLATVPLLVTGLDLATARLLVASLDLDDLHAGQEVAHG